jgi:hypothetical protein
MHQGRLNRATTSEHLARLGVVALPEPVRARQQATGFSPTTATRRVPGIHNRIAMPSEDEERVARVEAARANVAFWERTSGFATQNP